MVSLSREREALILANLDLVASLSRGTPDPEEFFSIGQLTLVLAAGRHDLSMPQEAFRAFARKAIVGAFNTEHRKRSAARALRESLTPRTVLPEEEYRVEDLPQALQDLLAAPRVQAILAGEAAQSLYGHTVLQERSLCKLRREIRELVCREL